MASSTDILKKYGLAQDTTSPKRSSDVLAKYGLLSDDQKEELEAQKAAEEAKKRAEREKAYMMPSPTYGESFLDTASEFLPGLAAQSARGVQSASRGTVSLVTQAGASMFDPLGLTGAKDVVRQGVNEFFQPGIDATTQMMPESYQRGLNNKIIEKNDETGEWTVRAPSSQQLVGTIAETLPQIPSLVAGGGGLTSLFRAAGSRGGLAAAAGYGTANAVTAGDAQFYETYNQVLKDTGNEQQALEAAKKAQARTEGLSFVTGAAGLGLASKFGAGASTRLQGAGKGALLDSPFEAIEEAGQYLIGQDAAGKEARLDEGLSAGALGLTVGAIPGAAVGFAQTPSPKKPKVTIPETGDPAFDAGAKVAAQIEEATKPSTKKADFDYTAPSEFDYKPDLSIQENTPNGNNDPLKAAAEAISSRAGSPESIQQSIQADPEATAPETEVEAARARTVELERSIQAQERQQRVISELASSKDKKVSQAITSMIESGRVKFFTGNEAAMPEGSSETNKGYFDGNTLYLNENLLEEGEANSVALHEVKHYMDRVAQQNGEAVRERSLRRILGDEGNATLVTRVQELAKSGNRIAAEALADAEYGANGDPAIFNDEVGAYFLQRAQAAREAKKPLGRAAQVVKDMVSYAKATLSNFGIDLNLSENDLLYLGRQLAGKAASLNTDVQGEGRAMVAGRKAMGYAQARENGEVWLDDLDNMERFEIDDSGMKIRAPIAARLPTVGKTTLAFLVDHPKMYEQYPDLRKLPVNVMTAAEMQKYGGPSRAPQGFASGDSITINPKMLQPGNEAKLKKLVAHETQHIIQHKEGFSPGASWREFLSEADEKAHEATAAEMDQTIKTVDTDLVRDLQKKLPDGEKLKDVPSVIQAAYRNDPSLNSYTPEERELITRFKEVRDRFLPLELKKLRALDKYKRVGGEVESRTVEARIDMTPEERKATGFQTTMESMPGGVTPEYRIDTASPASGSRIAEMRKRQREEALKQESTKDGRASKTRPAQPKKVAKAGVTQQPTERTAPKKTATSVTETVNQNAVSKRVDDLKAAMPQTIRMAWDAMVSPTQGRSTEVNEIMETGRGGAMVSTIKGVQAANRLNAAMKGVKDKAVATDLLKKASSRDDAERASARATLAKNYPGVWSEYQRARLEIQKMGLQIRQSILDSGKRLTNDDLRNIKAIEANMETYLTRAYRVDMKGDVAKEWVKETQGAWEKGKKTDGAQRFENAKEYLKKQLNIGAFEEHEVTPGGYDVETLDRLTALYEAWVPREKATAVLPSQAKPEQQAAYVEQVIKELKEAKAQYLKDGTYTDALDKKAIALTKELLDRSKQGGSAMAQFFRGARSNRTVVTERKDIAPAIRKLWGEIEEPVVNLAMTLMRQGKYLADARMLQELYDTRYGKDFTDPAKAEGTRFTEKLTGPTLGPLEGMMATPEFKMAVDSHVFQRASFEAFVTALGLGQIGAGLDSFAGMVMNVAAKPAGLVKKFKVIYNLEQYVNNVIGSVQTPLLSGFVPAVQGGKRGLEAALGTVAAPRRKELSKRAAEMFSLNMQESGQVGEIQSAQRELLVRELLGHGRRFGPLHAADEAITDIFAITDNTSRFATVYAWSDWLKKYYKAKGETRTEEQLLREAAEITKRRSVTFSRVPTALKAVERSGLTMFLPYFYETFRVTAFSAYDSLKMVKDGLAEGGKAGRMKADQGLRGFAGTMGSIALFKMAMGAMVKAGAAGLAILGMASDEPPEADEENLKRIQEAMGDRYDGKTLHLLEVTPNGRYVFLEGERMAMLDPSFGSILKLAQGDVDGATKDLSNLLFSNTLYKRFWEMATEDKPREPTAAQQFPETYPELQNFIQNLTGVQPEDFDRFSRIAELGVPTTAMTGSAAFAAEQDFSPETNLLAGTGAKLAIYDPKRSLKTDVRREYGNVVNEQRDAFKDVYSATNPSDATLRKRYQEGLVKEFEAFEKLQKLVDGARAAGLKDSEIRGLLSEEASLTKPQIASAMSGTFKPTIISDKVLKGTKDSEMEKVQKAMKIAKTPEEKKKVLEERDRITDKYKRLRTIVLELNKANNIKPIEE